MDCQLWPPSGPGKIHCEFTAFVEVAARDFRPDGPVSMLHMAESPGSPPHKRWARSNSPVCRDPAHRRSQFFGACIMTFRILAVNFHIGQHHVLHGGVVPKCHRAWSGSASAFAAGARRQAATIDDKNRLSPPPGDLIERVQGEPLPTPRKTVSVSGS